LVAPARRADQRVTRPGEASPTSLGRPAEELLAGLPAIWPQVLLPRIRRRGRDRTLVVLDDDPTGTQTVRGVRVLIGPSTGELAAALAARPAVVFVLTNSRSLARDRAVALAGRLGRQIRAASRRAGRAVSLVSRSDSTLRGHFPAEVDALAEAAGIPAAPVLFMPYLGEGGRVTIEDVHYLVRDGIALPVAATEFARDPAFGYRESNLREWVSARVGADRSRLISSLSLEAIRTGGPEAVADALRKAPERGVVIANAADDRDAEAVAAGVLDVETERPILARTAAGYVRARAGQPRMATLMTEKLRHKRGPGLVVVGSHVETTTRQLNALLADPPASIELVEVPAREAADPRRRGTLIRQGVERARAALERGAIPVVATSREVLPPALGDPTGLTLAGRLSHVLAAIVRELEPLPTWILAKGGITSSDVASRGLLAHEARVVGPLLPGVPVWRVPRGGRRAVLLAVFPGNVGDDEALRWAVAAFASAPTLTSARG